MADSNSAPPGAPGADVSAFVAATIAAAQANGGGSAKSVEDMPLIPLWKVRPAPAPSQKGGPSGAGSSAAADRAYSDAHPGAGSSAAADRQIIDAGAGDEYSSPNAAEVHWMEMPAEDRLAFADLAQKAGLWKPTQGPDELAQAWAKSVGWAAKYNYLHQDDKSKWLSPFEAATNMAIAGMADANQMHDGFSTESTIQQFTTGQLAGQAKQILQAELGRNPTDSELKAYTVAVNAAARATPQQVVTQQTDNPDGSKTADRVVSGGVDPNAIIQDMAAGTTEAADFKAASQYLPALQAAISGGMQLG